MTPLTAKQQSFINMLRQSDELARKGFQLLLKRHDYPRFFDVLKDAGFFAPEKNPAPVVDEAKNTVRVPVWAPLDYLKSVAGKAGQENDGELAAKVMEVVRDVSGWRDNNGELRHNFHTSRTFAEILGLVPPSAVRPDDIELLGQWLNGTLGPTFLIAHALDTKALAGFLGSADPEDWRKAARVLYHVTAITWQESGDQREPKPVSVVDDFWLGEFLRHHAKQIGEKARGDAAGVMIERVREAFGTPMRRDHGELFRPAVGDDAQNYQWRSVENRVVEGLRDVLLGWSEEDPDGARTMIERLLRDDLQMIRRVGVYILGQRWAKMSDLFSGDAIAPLIGAGHSPELYHVLQDHFAKMTEEQQSAVLEVIEGLPKDDRGDDPESLRRRRQHRWLSAVSGKGYEPADQLFGELDADPSIGKLGDHPDFDSYISGWVGPGQTPYSPDELVALTEGNAVVERLNNFTPTDYWRGPTIDGLSSALGSAARTRPGTFLASLPQFLAAKPVYQQAVINGLKGAWEAKANANWDQGWEKLVSFFEQVVNNHDFWRQVESAQRDWIVRAIADCLHAGTKQDDHAYPAALLPRSQLIIASLLGLQPGADATEEDSMLQALNTTKGRVVEALYNHALRSARISDRERGNHREVWEAIGPVFDAEFAKCKNGNFEFSTLAGAYLSQLQYLDAGWTDKRIEWIFPAEYEANTVCAIDGLAYASFTRPVYEALAAHGVIDGALDLGLKGRDARGRLLERIGAAYLWGLEELDGPIFTKIFRSGSSGDLGAIVSVFWTVRSEPLAPEQRERVLAFWRRALEWAQTQEQVQAQAELLLALSSLVAYITTLEPDNEHLLETIAPHLGDGYQAYEFVAQLLRLAEEGQSPAAIVRILRSMIASQPPEYDYEGHLLSLLEFLARHGEREAVRHICDQLRHLPGAKELFDRLTDR